MMGGRGSFASGDVVPYRFETIGKIDGIKVLRGKNGAHGLPEEAHRSTAYFQLNRDGTVRTLRLYDKDHYLVREISKHPEKTLDPSGKPVLHFHEYERDFTRTEARLLTEELKAAYEKYFEGVWL